MAHALTSAIRDHIATLLTDQISLIAFAGLREHYGATWESNGMSSYAELWCFRSGNMMATFASEREAWDWPRHTAVEFGIEEFQDWVVRAT